MRWLLCDYGEVISLAPPAADRDRLVAAARWPGTRAAGFWAAYWLHRPDYDRADVTAAEYWTRVLGHEPDPGTVAALTEVDTAMWLHPNRETLDAVADIQAGRAVFSNAPVKVAEGIDRQPWLDPFTLRFYSCRLRATKPDPAAYLAVLDELQAEPGDVVFVDDRPANVDAARALGLVAYLFEGPQTLRALGSGSPPRPG